MGSFSPVQWPNVEMLRGPMVNLTSAKEHVLEIERRIWVVKERFRATRHSLFFIWLPVRLTIKLC